jgi:hypothetical protein
MITKVTEPDKGQPLDISYLHTIVQAINSLVDTIGTSFSKIKYRDIATPSQLSNSNLVFYAETLKIVDGNLSVQSSTRADFSYSGLFKTTPVVLCSVTSVTGVSNLYAVLGGVTENVCQVNVFSSLTSGAFSADISIIAIGERLSS